METIILKNREMQGKEAARKGADLIREAINAKGEAFIIVPAGSSQFEMLRALVKEEIDWSVVTAFHLDEYLDLPLSHPASFRKYVKERFADIVNPREMVYVNGETDPLEECIRLGEQINNYKIDVAFVGIGENGHLAFNDPPADFETEDPFIIVKLDEACRRQQLSEGWFPAFADVPEKAITMSVQQIMKSNAVICTVPDLRKAEAVKKAIKEPVSPLVPATILRNHDNAWLFLDYDSASLL